MIGFGSSQTALLTAKVLDRCARGSRHSRNANSRVPPTPSSPSPCADFCQGVVEGDQRHGLFDFYNFARGVALHQRVGVSGTVWVNGTSREVSSRGEVAEAHHRLGVEPRGKRTSIFPPSLISPLLPQPVPHHYPQVLTPHLLLRTPTYALCTT